MNIVLLTIDALRADRLSTYGYERKTSPNITQEANNGILFRNAFSTSSHTRESVPSILTGKYPDEAIGEGYSAATELISEKIPENYDAGGFHSNPFVSRVYGFGKGFDEFYDDLWFPKHKYLALIQRGVDKIRGRHYARAEEINSKSINWLKQKQMPVFLWNHYMDVHGPYEPPVEYMTEFGEEISKQEAQDIYDKASDQSKEINSGEGEKLSNLYDSEILYTDHMVGEMISNLKSQDLYEDTMLIITSDHGDAFGEDGYYAHPSYKLDRYLLNVPLIISGGAIKSQTEPVERAVSTLDVLPTILEAVGLPADELPGQDLLTIQESARQNRVVFSQSRGSWKDENRRTKIFAGNDSHDTYIVERDFDTSEIINSKGTTEDDSSLADAVKEHSADRLGIGTKERDDKSVSEVSNRLEALGYK